MIVVQDESTLVSRIASREDKLHVYRSPAESDTWSLQLRIISKGPKRQSFAAQAMKSKEKSTLTSMIPAGSAIAYSISHQ